LVRRRYPGIFGPGEICKPLKDKGFLYSILQEYMFRLRYLTAFHPLLCTAAGGRRAMSHR